MPVIPLQRPHHWGTYPSQADLPNVSGSQATTPNLQQGDLAFSQADGPMICQDPTPGAAIWVPLGGGGGGGFASIPVAGATYESISTTTEQLIGGMTINGGELPPAGSGGAVFRVVGILNLPSGVGGAEVRLYDLGDVAVGPSAAMLVGSAQFQVQGGPFTVDVALDPVPAPTAGTGQIYDSDRMYEIRGILVGGATAGTDSLTVLWAGVRLP